MEIIGAAALIAVGLVVAAVTYARLHRVAPEGAPAAVDAQADWDRNQRTAELARREDAVARREADLERSREEIARRSQELTRSLEQVSSLSTARAKQLLLQEIEE